MFAFIQILRFLRELFTTLSVAVVVCLVLQTTPLMASEKETPLPGMTQASSSDISVQTCRDQAYTLKIARMLDALRQEFVNRFQASTAAGRFDAYVFKTYAEYRDYAKSKKMETVQNTECT